MAVFDCPKHLGETVPDSSTTPQAEADGRGPAPITVAPESPAVAEARDALLAAIGAEAQNLAEQFPGQASAQLAELARAYTLTTRGYWATSSAYRFAPGTDQPEGPTAKNMITGTSQADVALLVVPAEQSGFAAAFSKASTAEVPAAASARDLLLRAIGTEAQSAAKQFPGQASAQLAELAHAYRRTTMDIDILTLVDSLPDSVDLPEPAIGITHYLRH
nr:hypothetical protein KitaXyl93_05640 [Kitasatospora sp. Xyl93]